MHFQSSDNLPNSSKQVKLLSSAGKYKVVPFEMLVDALPDLQNRVLLLDFDETLWLRNSTEAFLGHTRPAWLVSLLLSLVMLQRPVSRRLWPRLWISQKDWLRVGVITVFLPWSLLIWRRQVRRQKLGRKHQNSALISALKSKRPSRIIVISNGFTPIVTPLMESIDIQVEQLISAPLLTGSIWRGRGKSSNSETVLGETALDNACFVTDHIIDEDLLVRVGFGILCEWPEAEYNQVGLSFARNQ